MSPRPHQAEQVRNLRILCGLVVVVLLAAVWSFLPYLVVEHRRLEAWKIVGLWSGDFVALLWFIRFAHVHAFLGEPFAPVPVSWERARLKPIVLAGLAALVMDLAFTLGVMADERAGYNHGEVTNAEILSIRTRHREKNTWYEVECRFQDLKGVDHEAHLRIIARGHSFSPTLPPGLARTLNDNGAGQFAVRYDPRFPARAWVDGQGWQDDNAIYWFSLLTLFFQSIAFTLHILLLKERKSKALPWWWDVYKVLPLAVEAFWMLTMGLIDRLLDSIG